MMISKFANQIIFSATKAGRLPFIMYTYVPAVRLVAANKLPGKVHCAVVFAIGLKDSSTNRRPVQDSKCFNRR